MLTANLKTKSRDMGRIRVEFFGIAKQRAGIAETIVETESDDIRLGDVLTELVRRLPALDGQCISGRQLLRGFAANVNGEQFVTDTEARLQDGSSLLIMSSDAGG